MDWVAMVGAYRFLLASMVVVTHVAGIPGLGGYAVFGFFILSGYLMTAIMHDTYDYVPRGQARFALNRLLRIFPTYWTAALLSAVVMAMVGARAATAYAPAMAIPANLGDWLQNATLVHFGRPRAPMLIPPAWALFAELVHYALIGMGATRSPRRSWWMFAIGCAYFVGARILRPGADWGYFAVPAATLPFAIGGLIWHYRESLATRWPALRVRAVPFLILAASVVAALVAVRIPGDAGLNILLQAVAVASLTVQHRLSAAVRRWDQLLGSLSYPLYVIHEAVALSYVGGLDFTADSWPLFAVTFPTAILGSWLIHRAVERPIDTLRARVKKSLPPTSHQ